jgi:hypothetical protein
MALGFPGLAEITRRTVRAPINPLDRSTIVSIFPKKIDEVKPTIQPYRYTINPGTYDKPSLLVVQPASWWRELEPEQPLLEIPVSSVQLADSIVKDWASGLLGCNMNDAMPGVFYIPGEVGIDRLKKEYKNLLDDASTKQKNWYLALVKMGDMLWARTNGNPLTISDDMKLAAQELQLKEKPWIKDFSTMELTNCPACGALRNPLFPVCGNCKTVIDKDKFKTLGLSVQG